MAIPDKIKQLANDIRTKIYGREVRESLAQGIEEAGNIADEANSRSIETQTRQDDLEARWDDVVRNATATDPSSVEIVDARGGQPTLNHRLDGFDDKIGILSKKTDDIISVKEFGAKGDYDKQNNTGTDDTVAIKNALSLPGHKRIYIPKGTYLISTSLVVYSDTTIIAHPQAEIIFKPNSASTGATLIENDTANGIKNITIIGGIWNGNGDTQPHDSQRGLRFIGVTNLCIKDMQVTSINGWGIMIQNCQNFLIENIEFDQLEGYAQNGDGIHISNSSDGIVQNIRGFTNDDMIALYAGDPISSNMSDVNNVIIRNIRTNKKGLYETYKAVAIYATNGYKVDNILVDGIVGNTYAPIVIIANPSASSGIGYFGKITLSNITGNAIVERQPFNIDKYNDVNGDNSIKLYIDSLIINNYQRKKLSTDADDKQLISMRYTDIKNLFITNISDGYEGYTGLFFHSVYCNIKNIFINNVRREQLLTPFVTKPLCYFVNTIISFVSINNISDIVLSNPAPLIQVESSSKIDDIRINGVVRKITTGYPNPPATLLYVDASSEVTDVEIDNVNITFSDNSNAAAIYQYGKIDRLFLNNVKNFSKTLPNPIKLYIKNDINNSSNVTFVKFSNIYSGMYYSGYANFDVISGKVRASGIDVVADLTKITDAKKGDLVTTKDGNIAKFDGSAWNNL